MARTRDRHEISPRETDIGSDRDVDITAQTITSHVIREVVITPEPAWLRKKKLLELRIEIEARKTAGHRDDLSPLLEEIDTSLEALSVDPGLEDPGLETAAGDIVDAPDTAPTIRRGRGAEK